MHDWPKFAQMVNYIEDISENKSSVASLKIFNILQYGFRMGLYATGLENKVKSPLVYHGLIFSILDLTTPLQSDGLRHVPKKELIKIIIQ